MGQCYKFVFSEIGLVKSAGSCFFTKDDIIGFSQIETTNLILRVDRQSKSYGLLQLCKKIFLKGVEKKKRLERHMT